MFLPIKETLFQLQHRVSHLVGDLSGASFLAAFDTTADYGRQDAARMLSAASCPPSVG